MFGLTDEQRLLVETTRRYLGSAEQTYAATSYAAYWRQGAALGWSAVLADTERRDRFADLVLLAREFGRHVGVGPLGPVNLTVAALGATGADGTVRSALVDGTDTAAWVDGRSRWQGTGSGVTATAGSGGGLVLDGWVAPVESAAAVTHLLVTCTDATTVLLPATADGVMLSPMHSLDLHRDYSRASFTAVRVRPEAVLGGRPDSLLADWLLDLAVLVQLAELVGAMEWALETTLRWCFDRYSFGRPLAAYQAIQHRTADMAMWLEAGRAVTADATRAFAVADPQRSELISAAKSYLGRYAPELLQECVQLHGGIGVTAEHGLHRYLRRVAVDVATHGSRREHAARVGRRVEERVSA